MRQAIGELRKEPFRAHMAYLADDLLEGRGTGTRGHEVAARYVGAQFEALGLTPAGDNGTFYQRVPLREIVVDPSQCALTLTEDGKPSALKWGDDYLMRGNEVRPDESVEAPIVFAGYGVRTPDGRYDDYANLNVKGKIIALLPGAPPSLATELRAHLSSGLQKLTLAREHGAIGVITLATPKSDLSRRGPEW